MQEMSRIELRMTPFTLEIVGVKSRTAGPVVSTSVLVEGIADPGIQLFALPVEVYAKGIIDRLAVRLIFQDIPLALSQWAYPARRYGRIKSSAQRRIDIDCAQ